MQAHRRAFLHSLAEDFGLDSESQDPEPHRHVCIFKTPRFVSAPMKTLAQCVKIKPVPATDPAPSSSSSSKGLVASAEPFNAFLLANPRFGLTIDELHSDLRAEFAAANIDFDISFPPSGEVVLRAAALPTTSGSGLQKRPETAAALVNLKPSISKKIKARDLASAATLCAVDGSLNVVRREDDHAGGGWSQVARGGGSAAGLENTAVAVKCWCEERVHGAGQQGRGEAEEGRRKTRRQRRWWTRWMTGNRRLRAGMLAEGGFGWSYLWYCVMYVVLAGCVHACAS